ncbi:protein kinase [Paenibacillus athensensis]|nr:protein kinase [Paenibacillus athensensis]
MLEPGFVLGNRYEVDSLIAKGGMGNVYLVKDAKLNGKMWAVKEINRLDNTATFLEEARLLTGLSHPYIPKITDYFEPDAEGRCYLVMEYISGMTLQERFESCSRQMPLEKIIKYVQQLCDILMYLHAQAKPIIFRDIKPSNMMVDVHDNVQLIDFGIARSYDQGKFADTVQMGTIAFAAPEQFEQKQTDQRTDVYGVGALLFYLLTEGKYVFQHYTAVGAALSHLPESLQQVVSKALEQDPNRRFQRMGELREQLRSFAANTGLPGSEPVVYPNLQVTRTLFINPMMQRNAMSATKIEPAVIQPAQPEPFVQPSVPETQAKLAPAIAASGAPYTTQATQSNPALIVYLLDASGSMGILQGNKRRIDIVRDALHSALRQMVFRSTKGSRISSRYRIALLAYSDEVYDLSGGVKKIDQLMNTGELPVLETYRFTDTAKAFLYAEKLLKAELPNMQDCPAPLVCHMTDGVYTGEDPQPIVERIRAMTVKDGSVLVENIFISDEVLEQAVTQPKRWPGVGMHTPMLDEYGSKLRRMSSPIPESYREMMLEANYRLEPGSLMMFPGTHPELVSLGFQMSAATPIR